VSDGTRTRDRLDHNQELYQLSYAHHCALRVTWYAAFAAAGRAEGRGGRSRPTAHSPSLSPTPPAAPSLPIVSGSMPSLSRVPECFSVST
jgi:hypothetical protein